MWVQARVEAARIRAGLKCKTITTRLTARLRSGLAVLVVATAGGAAFVGAVGLAAPLWAGEISVTATGEILVAPDMAVISLAVRQRDKSARGASEASAEAMRRILARLQQDGVAPEQMQSSGLSLTPLYSRDANREVTGFEARMALNVEILDLARMGAVLDGVLAEGVNEFNGLRFALVDASGPRDAARVQAVRLAQARAALLSDAAGLRLGPLQQITDAGSAGGPQPMLRMMQTEAGALPVAAGQIRFAATVIMIWQTSE
ncbi:SIMPL domain-containing protein [Candidatus Halocynthiibacter alkanivorans]|uniref:SIMPL domain-containing protein n=1 Tax=Candidatus Halocynthiibacter alkanivorans TaxID=2267619 RepID=UPI000DF301C8|nr:SIMPL domain-containing protein [Candidatus Halocynthiibacter alkanivorans]